MPEHARLRPRGVEVTRGPIEAWIWLNTTSMLMAARDGAQIPFLQRRASVDWIATTSRAASRYTRETRNGKSFSKGLGTDISFLRCQVRATSFLALKQCPARPSEAA